ncbi:putative argininosuccinate lyase [Candidatus Carsonella ruddii CS isolate Thao2000]|uniref:Putative argininosuccinate lyase n=1 Tax=Candidatus Carsonella ruddii CS isolate Thao2000 TaxID=1202537 RepID=J7GTI1_CARRU|nr:lyase family protein [Candidatus Carsonella ruddii]AFP83849.1 putative argininosuccinate lyase [Candidatus Carsonella ruddii CS isolate Thao2000]
MNKIINTFFDPLKINKFLFFYELKIIFSYIKCLFYSNYINLFEKNKILNSIIFIKNSFKINNNIEYYLEFNLIKLNGELAKKFFFKKLKINNSLLIKLMLFDEIEKISQLLIFIRKTLIFISEIEFNTIIPEFYNNKIKNIITLAHHFLYWNEMFRRDHIRLLYCKKLINVFSFDPMLLYENNFINKFIIKKILKFKFLKENSLDSIYDKDYLIDFASFCSILMSHLKKICDEIILWSFESINFIKLSKKIYNNYYLNKHFNLFELIKNKTSKIYGNLINILIIIKNQTFVYFENLYDDKENLLENIFLVKNCLNNFRKSLLLIKFNKKNMYLFSLKSFSTSFNLINYLLIKGLNLNDSYYITNKCINYCITNNINLYNISINELKKISLYFDKDVFFFISLEYSLKLRNTYGDSSINQILKSIKRSKYFLNNIIINFKL